MWIVWVIRGCLHDILVRVSFRCEFIPVPTCRSVFVYMIPVRNVVPVRVIPVRVHSGSRTGTKQSYRYEIWLHSVPVSYKRGTRFHSGTRWVAELTGTGGACVLLGSKAPKCLVRTRAHMELRVILVQWIPCKRGTQLDFAPEWNSYRYHVNTPSVELAKTIGFCHGKLSPDHRELIKAVLICKPNLWLSSSWTFCDNMISKCREKLEAWLPAFITIITTIARRGYPKQS